MSNDYPLFICITALETAPDSKILFKESFQLINDRLLFLGTVTTAKATDWRHQLFNICTYCFYFSFAEGVF